MDSTTKSKTNLNFHNRSPDCQYRATRLWNELIQSFRDHMKCKSHRRSFRTHHNCFTGTAAVNVMFAVLKDNKTFTVRVTKNQATKLLQKFLEKHIIENVNGRWETEKFASNKNLFRFPRDLHSSSEIQIPAGPLKRCSALFMMISGNRILSPCRGVRLLSPHLGRTPRSKTNGVKSIDKKFSTIDKNWSSDTTS